MLRDGEVIYSGHHVGQVSIVDVAPGWRLEVAETSFHDLDDTAGEPELRLRVIETDTIDHHIDVYLNREHAERLIVAIRERVDYLAAD
jgi:hypothetical protein